MNTTKTTPAAPATAPELRISEPLDYFDGGTAWYIYAAGNPDDNVEYHTGPDGFGLWREGRKILRERQFNLEGLTRLQKMRAIREYHANN